MDFGVFWVKLAGIIIIYISYNQGRGMDGKMHRYMQRIERLMATPTKAVAKVSPLRPTKSPLKHKPNHLDRYLKYELSIKIINNVINRNNGHLVMVFFNMIRNSQYRQKEKIYKFVAIERQEARVDLGIAAKLMMAVTKQLVKKRFAQFLANLQNDRQSLGSSFKKQLKFDQPGELIRANSQYNPKISSSGLWLEDMEHENEKAAMLKKINLMKAFTAKVIVKFMHQSFRKLLSKGFEATKIYVAQHSSHALDLGYSKSQSKAKIWQEKQKDYLNEIQQLSEKLSKCELLLLKQSNLKMNESGRKSAQPTRNSKLDNCYNNIFCFVSRKADKEKFAFLKQITISLHEAGLNKKRKRAQNMDSFLKGGWKVAKFLDRTYRTGLQKLKQAGKRQKPEVSLLLLRILQLSNKRKTQYSYSLFQELRHISKPNRAARKDLLSLNYDIEERSNSSRNIDSRSNRKISVNSNTETLTPVAVTSFHFYVDKIFKLILVVSKLLIPMKEAFDKINRCALFSYQLEDKFKPIALKHLRESFSKICLQRKQPNTLSLKLMALQGVIREKLVESFSRIKIIAKESNLKIKLIPVKLHIVEQTKQFIEERRMYQQYSLDNWSKLRENLLEDARPRRKGSQLSFDAV